MSIWTGSFLALAGAVALISCGCAPISRVAIPRPPPWSLATPAAWEPNAGPLWRPATPTPFPHRPPGEDAWQFGDYAKAVAQENVAIQAAKSTHAPVAAQDYAIRADSEAETERLDAAWADFRQAIRLAPRQEGAYINFGLWLDRAHQPVEGVAVLILATHNLPRNARCWGLLGWLQYQAGQYRASLASSRHSDSLDGGKPYIRYNEGLCYAALGDWPQAAAVYRQEIALGPDQERQLALMDVRNALREQPRSAALRRSEQMLMDAEKTARSGTQIQPNSLSGGDSLPK